MKISLNWLQDFIDLSGKNPGEIADILTKTGLEVEGIEKVEEIKGGLQGLVIGKVVSCRPHPNADKLSLTKVDVGQPDLLPIVCGAPNVNEGQKVVVATVGTTLYPSEGEPFQIKKAKIRGEVSEGMICAEDEIGLGNSHEGIMVLDTDLQPGTSARQYFKISDDYVLEIGLTPNRADAASHLGVARDLRAVYNRKVEIPDLSGFSVDDHTLSIEVVVENQAACPRYSGITLTEIRVGESPDWLKKRLRAIGQTPINNVVDVTNYVLHELGQPLHAFDAAKISGGKVVVKNMPEGTLFTTLDEKQRKLMISDLMICDSEKGMCIAGVFGGSESGVKETTTSIFLESAYFSPDYIRKTSIAHGLKTDASFRFERGTDPEMTIIALKRAALLIRELTGAKISSEIIDMYPEPVQPHRIKMSYSKIDRLIGKSLDRKLIFKILDSLDIIIKETNETGFLAEVPAYRVDVTREADLVEEILRIYGYDNVELPPYMSSSYLAEFPTIDPDQLQLEVTRLLAASGFNEMITNSLTRPAFSQNIEKFKETDNVEMLNKLSEDLGVLRQSLLFSGLDILTYNNNHRQRDLHLFEFGTIYRQVTDRFHEEKRLAIYITGNVETENWLRSTRSSDFFDLSAVVDKILQKFLLKDLDYNEFSDPEFEYGLQVSSGKTILAQVGKLKKNVTGLAELKQDVYYADIYWEQVLSAAEFSMELSEISRYPEVRRDLSLVIDKRISFKDIRRVALQQGSQLIRNINVFDYYEGENIGIDKKAYAMSFILQDPEKTLTDKVIDKTMERLIRSFQNELKAIIRK
jgi:phenylalanyl-tRNA synthetase beta chain